VREGITSSDTIFRVNKSDMENALQGVATEPKSERSGRMLAECGEDNGGGNDHEGEVPDHVNHEDRSGIGAAGVVVFIVRSRREGAVEEGIISSESDDLALLLFVLSFFHAMLERERERERDGVLGVLERKT
jgi:hypothetical protein